MARINLLPWREARRQEQRKQFLALLGIAAVAALAVVGLIHWYHSQLISAQQARNQLLQTQIGKLDEKIKDIKDLEKKREQLIARMRTIEQLQTSRPLIVHLFDELVLTPPDGVYLTEVSQTGQVVTIRGVARSNARVSNFMRNIDASPWLTDPVLDIIETKSVNNRRTSEFTLRATQKSLDSEEEEEAS